MSRPSEAVLELEWTEQVVGPMSVSKYNHNLITTQRRWTECAALDLLLAATLTLPYSRHPALGHFALALSLLVHSTSEVFVCLWRRITISVIVSASRFYTLTTDPCTHSIQVSTVLGGSKTLQLLPAISYFVWFIASTFQASRHQSTSPRLNAPRLVKHRNLIRSSDNKELIISPPLHLGTLAHGAWDIDIPYTRSGIVNSPCSFNLLWARILVCRDFAKRTGDVGGPLGRSWK